MPDSPSKSKPTRTALPIMIPARKDQHPRDGTAPSTSASTSTSTSTASGSWWRRESLMSETFSHADYTVIDVGAEEAPRLITCVKAAQGFDWNQEIFLPSYADFEFDDLERRQDPVAEIVVTEEEGRRMVPS